MGPVWDPTKSQDSNNIDDLLDDNEGSHAKSSCRYVRGYIKAFDILDEGLEDLPEDKNFPDPGWSDKSWEPYEPKKGATQWDVIRDKWKSPDWNEDEAKDVQTSFVNLGEYIRLGFCIVKIRQDSEDFGRTVQ
ncbi:hypothetical protein ACHAP5_012360 [Fusarium lateritium]